MDENHFHNFTPLTPAQRERLTMLAEEASELAQACTKALRHGLDCYNPVTGVINAEAIHNEFIDALAIVIALQQEGDIRTLHEQEAAEACEASWQKKLHYSHFQNEVKHNA